MNAHDQAAARCLDTEEIDKHLDPVLKAELEKQQIPGLAMGVAYDGRLLFARGYGLADIEHSRPVTRNTVFPILSITKTFTATAIMMLIERNRLSLDDPICGFLPATPAAWGEITVRYLLSHMTGLLDMYNDLPPEEWRTDLPREAFLSFIASYPLKFPAGERQSYCNTNFTLLGWIIESVTGRRFKEFMYESIFEPLQMEVNPFSPLPADHACGYIRENGALSLTDQVIFQDLDSEGAWNYGNGGFLSTVSDMAKWDAALGSERLLQQATREQMWTPARLRDGTTGWGGLGWGVNEDRGRKWVAHSGSSNGFHAEFTRYVTDHITVIAFANLGRGYRGLGDIVGEIAGYFLARVGRAWDLGR